MAKFCFVIHPLSFEDVVRYEPGAKGKGKAIIAKILEWMPPWAAAHVTGIRTPDGRETEGWFVAAPLLPQQMLDFPREQVYERVLKAIQIGAELGAEVAGTGPESERALRWSRASDSCPRSFPESARGLPVGPGRIGGSGWPSSLS